REYSVAITTPLQYAERFLIKLLAALSAAQLVFVLLGAVPTAAAQGTAAKPQQPPGVANTVDDEIVVVTASRREEQLLNAPATMTVLTEDVLSTAPGQSVTDLLRLVPGLNTIQTSARDVNVTSRGATST